MSVLTAPSSTRSAAYRPAAGPSLFRRMLERLPSGAELVETTGVLSVAALMTLFLNAML